MEFRRGSSDLAEGKTLGTVKLLFFSFNYLFPIVFFALAEKNKATNYHLGTLKAKIAKLKSELINGPGGKSAGSKDAGRGFDGKGSLTAFILFYSIVY